MHDILSIGDLMLQLFWATHTDLGKKNASFQPFYDYSLMKEYKNIKLVCYYIHYHKAWGAYCFVNHECNVK